MLTSEAVISPHEGDRQIDESVVVQTLSAHPEGISATALVNELVHKGYRPNDTKRMVRISIDRGRIVTGRALLLFPVHSTEAAA